VPKPWPEYEAARRTSRRRFIIGGVVATAGMLACGGLLAVPFLRQGPYPKRPDGLLVLDDLRYSVLLAVSRLILGDTADHEAVVRRIDTTVASLPLSARRTLLSLPPLLEGSGLLFGGPVSPFSELPQAQQRRLMEGWARSHILICRQCITTLRELVVVHGVGARPW
jgi:hypothetical protein